MTAATSDVRPATEESYTVEQVARLTGTTVRTIRWYQSEGLLPPPQRSGRVAVYDADHVSRLVSIRDLQEHGLTLTAIRRLLDRAPGSAGPTALAFIRTAVAQSSGGGDNEVVSEADGAARLGLDPHTRADASLIEELGLVEVLDDGRWRILAPAAFEAATELAAAGVPLEARVELSRVLHEHSQAMARAVVDMFVEYLWRPTELPVDDPAAWASLADAVTRLRPLAATSVAGLFDAALAQAAEAAAERELLPPADGEPDTG